MTVCKRIGAWLLTLVLLVSALPYTAFAASEDSHVVNATMEETSVEDIASNVTTQLLRGAKTKNETLSMEAKPTHEDSDPVEIIVVVDDSVAKPAAQAQVQSLLQKQEKAAATMSRAIGETVEPQRQYTTLLNGFSATVTYGQYKALKELDCVESVFLSPTFSLLPDTANSTRMIGGGLANETGFTGEGMLIAILDTGVDMDHQIFSKAPANPALTQDAVKDLLSQYDFQAEGIVKGLSVSSVYKSAKFPFQFDYGDKDTDGAPGTEGSHGTHVASTAAGRTGLVCAGGSTVDAETFLTQLYDQIHTGGAVGNATGRNIHQRSLDEAVRLTKAISAITLADYTVADALKVFNGEADFAWED